MGEITIRRILKKYKLPILNYGIYYPYLGIVFRELGYRCAVYIHQKTLLDFRFNKKIKNRDQLFKLADTELKKCTYDDKDSKAFLQSIRLINHLKIPLRIQKKLTFPNFYNVYNHMRRNRIIIPRVCSGDYYNIKGDTSGHSLVLCAINKEKFCIDPYASVGHKNYVNWSLHLKASQDYNWRTWSDDMVVIYSSPTHV